MNPTLWFLVSFKHNGRMEIISCLYEKKEEVMAAYESVFIFRPDFKSL